MDFSAMGKIANKTGWGCHKNRPRLTAYNDGELPPVERARVAAHLDRCAACAEEREALAAMSALLRTHPPQASLPASDLWTRLEAQIRADAPPAARRRVSLLRPFPVFGGLTAAVAAVVGAALFIQPLQHQMMGAHARPKTTNVAAVAMIPPKSRVFSEASVSVASTIQAAKREAKIADARPDPFARQAELGKQSASLPARRTLLATVLPKPKHHRLVQIAAVKHRVFPSPVEPLVEPSADKMPNDARAAGTEKVALVAPVTGKADVVPGSLAESPRSSAVQTAAVVAVLPPPMEPTMTAPDTVSARNIPAAATTVAEMSGPLRRQSGLFSYQAH